MASYDITSDSELKTRVRQETGYDDLDFELPDSDLDGIIQSAKQKVFLETNSEAWYNDTGLGFALLAYTKMRAKAQVENANIDGYELGDQEVNVRDADPDTSQQIQMWADDAATGISNSKIDTSDSRSMRNTSGYIGEQYITDGHDYHH